MKAAFITLGCKLNYAESSTYIREFKKRGCEIAGAREKADIYVINTCSVTQRSDAKSRNEIRKVHRLNPEAKIFVTGCSAELRRCEIEKLEGVTRVFGAREKGILVSEAFGERTAVSDGFFLSYSSGEERTRSFLKVQDGCNNFCKYCTVPYARGESRNAPICTIVREARDIASHGIKEIVLTGVNTGDFGRSTGESFLELLKALDRVEGIERYRISSIEPNLLSNEIVDWIASGTKFLPHFHIPLQNGCDEILSAMGRHYTTDFFKEKIKYIRSKFEGPGKLKVFFGIDLMVGLPGESEELFEKSRSFIESLRPAFIHVFPYSKRPGTVAAEMKNQVSEEEKTRRVEIIEELCGRLYKDFVEENGGLKAKVLFEDSEKNGMMFGFTENYIKIARPFDRSLAGKISEIVI